MVAGILDVQRAVGRHPRAVVLLRVSLCAAAVGPALATYRESFQPSIVLSQPHVMVAASVICAPSAEEAAWQSGASALSIVQMRTGRPGEMPSPEEAAAHEFSPTRDADRG